MTLALALATVVVAAATIAPAPSPTLPALPIGGALVRTDVVLDARARGRLARANADARDHDGSAHRYGGVRIADVLRDAGAPIGDAVRGPAARAYVVVSATDGYEAVFALGELDTAEPRCAPILADREDDASLAADEGPIRIVAPCDRTHARLVHGVTKLTVVVAMPGP